MRILAARGQDPVLITSWFFFYYLFRLYYIFFPTNDNTFRIRNKPVDGDRDCRTMTALQDNNIHMNL